MENNSIYDPEFETDDVALYRYYINDENEKNILVRIIGKINQFYLVTGNPFDLQNAGLDVFQINLKNNHFDIDGIIYKNVSKNIRNMDLVAFLDPDELEPYEYTKLTVMKGNI